MEDQNGNRFNQSLSGNIKEIPSTRITSSIFPSIVLHCPHHHPLSYYIAAWRGDDPIPPAELYDFEMNEGRIPFQAFLCEDCHKKIESFDKKIKKSTIV